MFYLPPMVLHDKSVILMQEWSGGQESGEDCTHDHQYGLRLAPQTRACELLVIHLNVM